MLCRRAVQCEVMCAPNDGPRQDCLELWSAFEPLHDHRHHRHHLHSSKTLKLNKRACHAEGSEALSVRKLDSQPLATFGPTGRDDSAAATCFHAGQKTVRAGAFDFRGLIGAFHGVSSFLLK